jgi:hypothetical protein
MTQESRTQETPTPAQNSGELTDTELALVVGGGDTDPGALGAEGPYETAAGRRVLITVPT